MYKIICLMLVVLFGSDNLSAKIITTDNVKIIEAELVAADNSTLVAFDCDEVLISANDDILSPINKNKLNDLVVEYSKYFNREMLANFKSIVMRDMKMHLISKQWPRIISDLQSRSIKTMLITATETGNVGVIESMEQLRRNQLLAFGIDFKKSWPDLGAMKLVECAEIQRTQGIPSFSDGMVLSGDASKGNAIEVLLSKIKNIKFNKIIFIDDKKENLQSVDAVCKSLNIEFVGIEYTGYKSIANEKIDMQKARNQFDILMKKKKWPSCDEKK